jgi:hypothetical protein
MKWEMEVKSVMNWKNLTSEERGIQTANIAKSDWKPITIVTQEHSYRYLVLHKGINTFRLSD